MLTLFLSACNGSPSPEEVVGLYLSETVQEGMETALQRWELSEVGTEFFTLDPEQNRIRMDGRRTLATDLTEVLGIPGPRLTWKQEGASYYVIRDGVPLVTHSLNEAVLATVEMRVAIEGNGKDTLEERLAFNLWKNPEDSWKITGLDKGSGVLEPFLDKVREFE